MCRTYKEKILLREIASLSSLEETCKRELLAIKAKKKSLEKALQELLDDEQIKMFE